MVFVRPDRCAIHVAPDAYAELRRVVARWPRVTVRCLPPRRDEDLLRSESEEARRRRRVAAEAPSDEFSDDGADDVRAAAEDESSDGDPEEDLREAFKLESFVDFVAGAEVVGVPCTPPARSKFTRPERYLASAADGKAPPLRRRDPPGMELEKWPLVQAYGLDGVGRDGFFTMTRAVVDAWSALRERCYFRADRASLARVLRDALPAFEQHWRDVLEHFERTSATHRARLDAEGALAPLADFFEFGALRALPHGPLRTPEEEAERRPKLTFHAHEAGPTRRTHFTLEGAHPKAPEIRCARTYLLCNAADEAAKAAGFRVGRRTRRAAARGTAKRRTKPGTPAGRRGAPLGAVRRRGGGGARGDARRVFSLRREEGIRGGIRRGFGSLLRPRRSARVCANPRARRGFRACARTFRVATRFGSTSTPSPRRRGPRVDARAPTRRAGAASASSASRFATTERLERPGASSRTVTRSFPRVPAPRASGQSRTRRARLTRLARLARRRFSCSPTRFLCSRRGPRRGRGERGDRRGDAVRREGGARRGAVDEGVYREGRTSGGVPGKRYAFVVGGWFLERRGPSRDRDADCSDCSDCSSSRFCRRGRGEGKRRPAGRGGVFGGCVFRRGAVSGRRAPRRVGGPRRPPRRRVRDPRDARKPL